MDTFIRKIFEEHTKDDTSFTHKSSALEKILGKDKYSEHEVRDVWQKGIRKGIEIGLFEASLEGQKIDLIQKTTNQRHNEFLNKLYALFEEYSCAIQHHPLLGMVVIDTTPEL